MTDRLYLSLWIRNPSPITIHDRYVTMLQTFPFSKFAPRLLLTVRGLSFSEAPTLEQVFETSQMDALSEALETWRSSDISFEVEGAWDLLQPERNEWRLAPSKVTLLAFGPEFERDNGDDLRIEFGQESLFLPVPESPRSFKAIEANIRSLLKLVHDLETALPVTKRLLWSESTENFAERLAQIAGN